MIGEYDARQAWAQWECRSMAHWMVGHIGESHITAREHVRVAASLRQFKVLRETFAAGRLSYARVRAVSRVMNEGNESELVELAIATTAAQLERFVSVAARKSVNDNENSAEDLFERRSMLLRQNDDDTWEHRATLPTDIGVMLRELLREREIEFRREHPDEIVRGDQRLCDAFATLVTQAAQTPFDEESDDRADNDTNDSAESFNRSTTSDQGIVNHDSTESVYDANAPGDSHETATDDFAESGKGTNSLRDRPETVITDSAESPDGSYLSGTGPDTVITDSAESHEYFDKDGDDEGRDFGWTNEYDDDSAKTPETSDISPAINTRNITKTVPAETVSPSSTKSASTKPKNGRYTEKKRRPLIVFNRYPDGDMLGKFAIPSTTADRHVCESDCIVLDHTADGDPLNQGRSRRSPTAAQRRTVLQRDQSCSFPGCNTRKDLHIHHIIEWGSGKNGKTNIINLIGICSWHHRVIHDQYWTITGQPGGILTFTRPETATRRGLTTQPPNQPVDIDTIIDQILNRHLTDHATADHATDDSDYQNGDYQHQVDTYESTNYGQQRIDTIRPTGTGRFDLGYAVANHLANEETRTKRANKAEAAQAS